MAAGSGPLLQVNTAQMCAALALHVVHGQKLWHWQAGRALTGTACTWQS